MLQGGGTCTIQVLAHPLFFLSPIIFATICHLLWLVWGGQMTHCSHSKQSTSSYRLSIPNRFLHSCLRSLIEDPQAYKAYHSPCEKRLQSKPYYCTTQNTRCHLASIDSTLKHCCHRCCPELGGQGYLAKVVCRRPSSKNIAWQHSWWHGSQERSPGSNLLQFVS